MMIASFNRFSASAAHLLVSVLVSCLCAAIVFLVWYPGAFADASGVAAIFLLLVGVDVVLGPLITLIIFNPEKEELRRDLLIIVLVQLLALSYGVYSVFTARPAFAVFNSARFDLVYANEISAENFAKAPDEYASAPLWGPRFVAANLPEDAELARAIVLQAVSGGEDVQNYPEFFRPLDGEKPALCKAGVTLEALAQSNPEKAAQVTELSQRYHGPEFGQVVYIPLYAKASNATVVVDCAAGRVIDTLDLNAY